MPKDRVANLSIDDLLKETNDMLKSLEARSCRGCKKKKILQDGWCDDCLKEKAAKRQEKLDNARHIDKGYVRVYRGDPQKLVYEHKWLMEEELGRPLNEREVVIHLDGNTLNNDLSNLALSLKGGTPFSWLVCTCCNSRGTISIVPLPDESPQQDQ